MPRDIKVEKVLVFHDGADAIRGELLKAFPDLDIAVANDDADVRHKVHDASVIIGQRFDPDPLRCAVALKWLHITLAGIDFLTPVKHYLSRVTVTNARGIIADHLANYVIGAVVALQWNFPELYRNQRNKVWKRWPTKPLAGQVIAIIGLGTIGREIANRAAVMGLTPVGVRASGGAVPGVSKVFRPEHISDCLGAADFVVMAVPSNPQTVRMIGEREFTAMKRSAYFINVARGAVVDEAALISALQRKVIAGACLDVFANEPLAETSPLWTFPNVMISPHASGVTTDYNQRNAAHIAGNFLRYINDRPLDNVIDVEREL